MNSNKPPLCSKKILLVEHQQDFVDFCKIRLFPEGVDVKAVLKGADALRCIQEEDFDLLLVEMWPFDMDSLEFLNQLKKLKVAIPVIITSEQVDIPLNRITQAIHLGAVNFIQKPCQTDVLLKSIRQALA